GDSKQTITTEDLPFIIADVLESESYKHIKLIDCSITSRLDESSVATINVNVKGKEHESTGTGNGGFDAFINAVNGVLADYGVVLPELADYEVRIPKGGHTSALTECVITWASDTKKRKTRGVHSNQVFASISAALRMINIQLHEKP
ncbi:MAG TPA: 2-isopropylmalate synthase, partial [Cycloclasticus sp.]|nr:2-isopropylmalate synthase [Cycloclasticus sp.]